MRDSQTKAGYIIIHGSRIVLGREGLVALSLQSVSHYVREEVKFKDKENGVYGGKMTRVRGLKTQNQELWL